MPTHMARLPSGLTVAVTLADPAAPHQIRLTIGGTRMVCVSCTCGAGPVETVDGAEDHWLWFNQLDHDEARGPFVAVDPVTGRATPATTVDETADAG